jgi:putative membrane protein
VRRVQAVRVVEGVLRRPFGLAALRVEVAGYAEEAAAARTLFPLLRRAEIEPFLAALLPELADDPGGLEPPPARAARRYVLPRALAGLVAGGAACLLLPAVAPWPLLLAPLLALDGWLDYRAAGWRLRDGRLAMRSRRLAWSTLLTPAARLQQHSIAQSPLQRRARLADLAVAVGKGGHAQVRHLELPVAAELWERLRR